MASPTAPTAPDNPSHVVATPAPTHICAPQIILATLNAKYIHASLGLRYLLANMARHSGVELRARTVLREFTINRPAQVVADALLAELGPEASDAQQGDTAQGSAVQVVGFGVYIWNVTQTCAVVRLLKAQRPRLKIVLGGPEVSHELEGQDIVALADHVITGWGDVSFPKLCRALIHGPKPLMKVIVGEQPPLEQLALPYDEYSQADLAHRVLYVEASRGCPFKCEFCLSSLDKTATAFELDAFLRAMDDLYQRGARTFKFVDRTFNLKIDASVRILQFFLDRLPLENSGNAADNLFVHFEVIPDHLPDKLKAMIAQFPPGVLQFEVGIQSFNVEVQQRISRRQDNAKTQANVRWLVEQSHAHLHTDLIFGLPGETLESFAQGFDTLYALRPHEIQLGILKRLRGTPIARHTLEHAMVYDAAPPYTVQQTGVVDAPTLQRFTRFARYWDLVANSGRFGRTLPVLLDASSPFDAFIAFADWLWATTQQTSGLTPEALLDALFDYLCTQRQLPVGEVQATLLADYVASGARSNPRALHGLLPRRDGLSRHVPGGDDSGGLTRRQQRHGAAADHTA